MIKSELPVLEFNSINDLIESEFPKEFQGSLKINGISLDFKFIRGEEEGLFVAFNAAIAGRKERKLPLFSGLGISSKARFSKIAISDPLLYLDEKSSVFWYLGSKKFPTQQIIIDLIRVIEEKINAKNIIFWGSSGGGFPAILMSYFFKNSIAFVNAPTTTIKNHHRKDSLDKVINFMKLSLNDELDCVTDLSEMIDIENKVVIIQNKSDSIFVQNHLIPYLKIKNIDFDFKSHFSEKTVVYFDDFGVGHIVPDRFLLEDLIGYISKNGIDGLSENILKSIKDASLDVNFVESNASISVNIKKSEEPADYALYVYDKNGIKEKIMYKNENTFILRNININESYGFIGFIRFKKNKFIIKRKVEFNSRSKGAVA